MNIVCNEHVRCELEIHGTYNDLYQFLPDEGYALWRDNETGNIDPETTIVGVYPNIVGFCPVFSLYILDPTDINIDNARNIINV